MPIKGNMRFSHTAAVLALILCSLGIAFGTPASAAEFLVGYFGYYIVLAMVILWAIAIWPTLRRWLQKGGVQRLKYHLLVLFGLTLVLCRVEPNRYKVVMDEVILGGTSLMMHRDRLALVPQRAAWVDNHYELLDGWMDKRPLLYPFLQSVVHDLSGFRVENGIYLNHAFLFGVVLLLFLLGKRLAGLAGGYGAVLLAVSAPLLANLASSAGLDLLGGLLLLLCLLLVFEFHEQPKETSRLNALVLSLVLLANTRYEGTFWIFPIGGLILWHAWQQRTWPITWAVLAAIPLMILPTLQRAVEFEYQVYWQTGALGREATFALSYLPDNLTSAAIYFFGPSSLSTSSYLLSIITFCSLLVLTLWLLLQRWDRASHPFLVAQKGPLAVLIIGFWGLFGLLMFFNWGYFEEYLAQRLSLPFQLLGAIAGVWAWKQLPWAMKGATLAFSLFAGAIAVQGMTGTDILARGLPFLLGTFLAVGVLLYALRERKELGVLWLAGAAAIALVGSGLPRAAAHRYTEQYASADGAWETVTYLQSRDDHYLYVSAYPLLGILAGRPAVQTMDVAMHPGVLAQRLKSGEHYRTVLYSQVYRYHWPSQGWHALESPDITPILDSEIVHRAFLTSRVELRIHEIRGVKHPGLPAPEPVRSANP